MAGGRKSAAEEWNTRNLCQQAIESKYGSLSEGCEALLKTGEPVLMRWVFEHALGKPVDKVQLNGETDNKLEVIVRYANKGDNPT
jgi:hypothetical protein